LVSDPSSRDRLESKAPQRGVDLTDPSCQRLSERIGSKAVPLGGREKMFHMWDCQGPDGEHSHKIGQCAK